MPKQHFKLKNQQKTTAKNTLRETPFHQTFFICIHI